MNDHMLILINQNWPKYQYLFTIEKMFFNPSSKQHVFIAFSDEKFHKTIL